MTHKGGSLVGLEGVPQPVLNVIGVFRLVPVILYIAEKRSPVVGGKVVPDPEASAPRWKVSAVSSGLHDPTFGTPPMHSTVIVAPPGRIVALKSTFQGLMTVWSAWIITSNPFSAAEWSTNTPMDICCALGAGESSAGVSGQPKEVGSAMQTTPATVPFAYCMTGRIRTSVRRGTTRATVLFRFNWLLAHLTVWSNGGGIVDI